MKQTAVGTDDPRTVTATPARLLASALRARLGARKFDLWFHEDSLHVSQGKVTVTAKTPFAADWIGRHFMEQLQEVAQSTLGTKAGVDLAIESSLPEQGSIADGSVAPSRRGQVDEASGPTKARSAAAPRRSSPAQAAECSWRTFDGFIAGGGNRLALESARQLALATSAVSRLLFLHGACGVGKTHLLQATCRQVRQGNPSAKIHYTTAEQFTNDYIAAIRDSSIEAFRRRIRKLDLLAIDDIHFLANKSATQSECLHTIDAMGSSGCRVALASDAHPRQIAKFSAPLVSRFLSGLVVRVEEPDRTTRLELARLFSLRRGLALSQGALEAIIERVGSNAREIEGAVMTVAALLAITPSSPQGRPLVEQALGEPSSTIAGRPVRVAQVIQAVCTVTGVDHAALVGAGRHRRSVLGRGLVAHLARELTTLSYPEIAQALGRSTHSTVHAAAARFGQLMESSEVCEVMGERISASDLCERARRELHRARG